MIVSIIHYSEVLMNHNERMELASVSLEGLSVGDAFGERFFLHPEHLATLIESRAMPKSPWRWTDDTAMAISVVNVLFTLGEIQPETLAKAFASQYKDEPLRGYAGGAHKILGEIAQGVPWKEAAASVFDGQGSFGNGGAMRSAPIGAYFWDDYDAVVKNASASAEPTHYHPEGRAGAIGIALATAYATRMHVEKKVATGQALIETVIKYCPDSETRNGIVKSLTFPFESDIQTAAAILGNGTNVSAQDTVPFCVWSSARGLGQFEDAMWDTVSVLGDRDTTCAIVGGIITPYIGVKNIPAVFLESREALPDKETLLF